MERQWNWFWDLKRFSVVFVASCVVQRQIKKYNLCFYQSSYSQRPASSCSTGVPSFCEWSTLARSRRYYPVPLTLHSAAWPTWSIMWVPRTPSPPMAPWRAVRQQVSPLLPPESWPSSWRRCALWPNISRSKMWTWPYAATGNLLHWSLTGFVWWLSLSSLSSAPSGSSCWHPSLLSQFPKI